MPRTSKPSVHYAAARDRRLRRSLRRTASSVMHSPLRLHHLMAMRGPLRAVLVERGGLRFVMLFAVIGHVDRAVRREAQARFDEALAIHAAPQLEQRDVQRG